MTENTSLFIVKNEHKHMKKMLQIKFVKNFSLYNFIIDVNTTGPIETEITARRFFYSDLE